ncbi:MAG: tRNA (adenosine(37)-N6)-dimethylallyltransferase MiaA [Alphaproteobacteria bacterium]|nr:tRNA (adenosine(37)-N6)-dimethylallyltransferase MiaA [Alphaproteobacteria bacterium]MDD9920576.1 tRNA (adenosine(37)-N6)-dimethylallyltransferase MiaA [Alphaproteobacteria bacterium]
MTQSTAITLFGPTASGKTGLAIALAQAFNGIIINADSRQFYKYMPILTAAPSAEEYAAAPHELYEIFEPDQSFSAGEYLRLATKIAAEVVAQGKMPIFVGGTGLYLDMLLHGISPMPDVPAEVLDALKEELETRGRDVLFDELLQVDAAWADKIPSADTQRLLRGLSVYRHTGKNLTYWQQQPKEGALPYSMVSLAVCRLRVEQVERIEARFEIQCEAGLLEEVKALLARGYSPELPALTSLGVQAFSDYFAEVIPFEEAREKYIIQQRQYAKRQSTWLKNSYPAQHVFENADAANVVAYVKKILPHPSF